MIETASFPDWREAAQVLEVWRRDGQRKAHHLLLEVQSEGIHGPLLSELEQRLSSAPGPRLLVDGVWLSRPYGGVTRVWQRILKTWQLPGLVNPNASIALINRNNCLNSADHFETLDGVEADPLDCQAVANLGPENASLARHWCADVFCSTWISTIGDDSSFCPELALVHDCMPERLGSRNPDLLPLRRRWLSGSYAHLCVSSATAQDVHRLLGPKVLPSWCHLAPEQIFAEVGSSSKATERWQRLKQKVSLPTRFLLLPATSSIGSYKNPELVAQALDHGELCGLPLVLCGLSAEQHAHNLEQTFPSLRHRLYAVGFTDSELALAYRHALAVVIPSKIEGFGLPAIEVMAAGGCPVVADSRGLREAGAGAALRFGSDQPLQLSALLQLLMHDVSGPWLRQRLRHRAAQRLQRLNPDLIGLALLALARQASDGFATPIIR